MGQDLLKILANTINYSLQEHQKAIAEAEAKNQKLLERAEGDFVSTKDVIQLNRQVHAKIVSKAAILKYEAANDLTTDMEIILEEVKSFKRAHKSSGRIGAEADVQKLKRLDQMLDNAITVIKK